MEMIAVLNVVCDAVRCVRSVPHSRLSPSDCTHTFLHADDDDDDSYFYIYN